MIDGQVVSPLGVSIDLQRQFQEVTKNQEIIQKRYRELWSWQGTITDTCRFVQFRMEGYMRKFVEKVKFFQTSLYPKRYFVVDFQGAVMYIKKDHK